MMCHKVLYWFDEAGLHLEKWKETLQINKEMLSYLRKLKQNSVNEQHWILPWESKIELYWGENWVETNLLDFSANLIKLLNLAYIYSEIINS